MEDATPEKTLRPNIDIMPWYIVKGNDGVEKDCILAAVMCGNEIESVSLHVASPPVE